MENKKSQAKSDKKSSERTKINYQMMIRLPKIHALIKSKKYPNKNDIIKYLAEIGLPKYSVMTITRDLEFLKYTLNALLNTILRRKLIFTQKTMNRIFKIIFRKKNFARTFLQKFCFPIIKTRRFTVRQ